MLSNANNLGTAPGTGTPDPSATSWESLRADPRVPFLGHPLEIRAGGMVCSIRLRDLSCGGASGLCDEALDVGGYVIVCLAKGHEVEAEVRWVRRLNVGLKFTTPLAPGLVRRLHQAHGTFVTTRAGT